MGVTTIAANTTMPDFTELRAIEFIYIFFIFALVTDSLTCHPQRFQLVLHNLHLQLHKSYTQSVLR